MPWVNPSPFGAFAAAAGGVLSGAAQAKKDKADADRQDRLDKAAAIAGGLKNTQTIADTNETLARTTGLANTQAIATADEARLARQGGDALRKKGELSPLTMPTAKPGQHISSRDQATQWQTRGTLLTNQGDTDDAKIAFDRADKLLAQAAVEDKEDLAVKAQAETALQHLAERTHMSHQELQAAKDELGRDLRAARANGVSLSNAATAAVARIQAASIGAAGALQRERETQAGAKTRGVYVQDRIDRRFNVGNTRKTAAAVTAATRQAGNTAHTRGQQSYEAVAQGTTFKALPGQLKDLVHHLMADSGLSVNAAVDEVNKSGTLSDPQKQQIKSALGWQDPNAKQGGGGLFGL
jgi:hypothetical protein